MIFILFIVLFSLICLATPDQELITFTTQDINSTTKGITISFVVPPKDCIYKDFITCSIHEQYVTLSGWKTNKQNISYYDPCFNDTKEIFNEDFSITMTATQENFCQNNEIHLYCSYYRKTDNKLNDAFFTFSFAAPSPLETHIHVQDADITNTSQADGNDSAHTHIYHSSFDKYYCTSIMLMRNIFAFLATNHKKCFYLLIILTALFLLLFSLYQEKLQQHRKLYEITEMMISLCVAGCVTCLLLYVYALHKSISKLLATSLSIAFFAITGIFYTIKSTSVSIGSLRTFYTCIGMLCIIAMMLCAFKTVQYLHY